MSSSRRFVLETGLDHVCFIVVMVWLVVAAGRLEGESTFALEASHPVARLE